MKFTLCKEDKVFPYMMIDDFYDIKEQNLIWKELDSYKDDFKIDYKTGGYGVACDKNNKPVAQLKRFYLDDIYISHREDSNILTLYKKILSEEVLEAYRKTTPSWRTFEITNQDCSVISYYENLDKYSEHFDKFMHTVLIWFYREPKRFDGGDFIFNQSNQTVECRHNRMIMFPSYYLHEAKTVNMKEEYQHQGLGRFCMAHFFTKG